MGATWDAHRLGKGPETQLGGPGRAGAKSSEAIGALRQAAAGGGAVEDPAARDDARAGGLDLARDGYEYEQNKFLQNAPYLQYTAGGLDLARDGYEYEQNFSCKTLRTSNTPPVGWT